MGDLKDNGQWALYGSKRLGLELEGKNFDTLKAELKKRKKECCWVQVCVKHTDSDGIEHTYRPILNWHGTEASGMKKVKHNQKEQQVLDGIPNNKGIIKVTGGCQKLSIESVLYCFDAGGGTKEIADDSDDEKKS